ncbi:sensor histidine kinase [Vibrio ordalii]|uniref:HAMP domain-containing sensor histidine kinase n=1 Tax=Vibrio ordalii TaxID=28174 RepID=UPI0002483566|nr:sensor histidine kinase [Vibrio ordalii]
MVKDWARAKRIFRTVSQHLVVKLFMHLSVGVVLLLSSYTAIEVLLLEHFLRLPTAIHREFQVLSDEADTLLRQSNAQDLARWEEKQKYLLYVVDEHLQAIGGREVHPHVQKKMHYQRGMDEPMGNKVSRPMIGIPLRDAHQLMIQLPWELHPARRSAYYLWALNLMISLLILGIISWVLTKQLQLPLTGLRSASHRLSQGETSVRVAQQLGRSSIEFQQLAHDFDRMAERIEGLIGEQKKLVRTLSHELKTPLARQLLLLHLLKKDHRDESAQLFLDQLEHESHLMNSMIEKILELSHLDSEHLHIVLTPLDVNAYLAEQTAKFECHLQSEQRLTFIASQSAPWILADKVLLGSALDNVLTNAVKYAGPQCAIVVRVTLDEQYVQISISDNGPGVAPADLAHIFEPFYQAKQSSSSDSGYGLGLSIVCQSIDKMQGKIKAYSVSGLELVFTFPCERSLH